MDRPPRIDHNDSIESAIAKAANSHPGAIYVLKLLHQEMGILIIPLLDKLLAMDIFGSKIWLAYDKWANRDIKKLKSLEYEIPQDAKELLGL